MTNNEIEILVKSMLSEKRYNHTLAVTKFATELAIHYGALKEDAYVAAMLHDITKEKAISFQLQMLEKSDIINNTVFKMNKNVYHAQTGYLYSRDILHIENQDVLNAIRYHTTGRADMSLLEKIIFTADTVAYDRIYDDAKKLRELSFKDIDKCMLDVLEFTIEDLLKKSSTIDLKTIECYNFLVSNIN